jgi:hypothetical protein
MSINEPAFTPDRRYLVGRSSLSTINCGKSLFSIGQLCASRSKLRLVFVSALSAESASLMVVFPYRIKPIWLLACLLCVFPRIGEAALPRYLLWMAECEYKVRFKAGRTVPSKFVSATSRQVPV